MLTADLFFIFYENVRYRCIFGHDMIRFLYNSFTLVRLVIKVHNTTKYNKVNSVVNIRIRLRI